MILKFLLFTLLIRGQEPLILSGSGGQQLAPNSGVFSPRKRVYDGTGQTTASVLQRILPDIFQDKLVINDVLPQYWSVIFTKGTEGDDVSGSSGIISDAIKDVKTLEAPDPDSWLNGLITYQDSILQPDTFTHLRFVEIPNVEGQFTAQPYSYGLSRKATFGANYNLTGLFIGSEGNLQIAVAPSTWKTLKLGFTDGSQQGKYVDLYVETGASQMDVYIAVDGRSFGHAAKIPGSPPLTDLLPAVRFSKDQTMAAAVIVWAPREIPPKPYYRTVQSASGPGLTGDWIIPEDRGTAVTSKPLVTVKVIDGASELSSLTREVSLTVKVVNTMKVKFKVGLLGQIVSRTPIMSTRMQGPQKLMDVENEILQLLECADTFIPNDQRQLLIRCGNDVVKQVFERYVDTADRAVIVNPWNPQ